MRTIFALLAFSLLGAHGAHAKLGEGSRVVGALSSGGRDSAMRSYANHLYGKRQWSVDSTQLAPGVAKFSAKSKRPVGQRGVVSIAGHVDTNLVDGPRAKAGRFRVTARAQR